MLTQCSLDLFPMTFLATDRCNEGVAAVCEPPAACSCEKKEEKKSLGWIMGRIDVFQRASAEVDSAY